MSKQIIHTENAPKVIGCYSQAVRIDNTVYFSGQIGISPTTMELLDSFESQTRQVFNNLSAVAVAAGGSLSQIVKLNIFVTDMSNFDIVNKVVTEYFGEPYPARAMVGIKELPKGAEIEADAIMVLD